MHPERRNLSIKCARHPRPSWVGPLTPPPASKTAEKISCHGGQVQVIKITGFNSLAKFTKFGFHFLIKLIRWKAKLHYLYLWLAKRLYCHCLSLAPSRPLLVFHGITLSNFAPLWYCWMKVISTTLVFAISCLKSSVHERITRPSII